MPTVLVARMKNELRPDDIPEWDGRKSTAICWFADIQEVAGNGGYVPWQLGQHLWLRLKEGTPIRTWYTTLTPAWKLWMKRHYLNFLSAIRTHYLGERWQQERSTEYALQRFRQEGHARESPLEFVQRRIMYTRMLLHMGVGTAAEVREVMANAPVSWKNILVLENVHSVMDLQVCVSDMESQLLEAARVQAQSVVTRENIAYVLRDAGYDLQRRQDSRGPGRNRPRFQATAHAVAHDEDYPGEPTGSTETTAVANDGTDDFPSAEDLHLSDPVVAEAYNAATRRQRPPPKGGYPFTKRDDVKSAVQAPPSPCKCCGSANHWDKECPWFNVWQTKFGRSKNVNFTESEEDSRYEVMYDNAFDTLNTIAARSLYLDPRLKKEAFVSTRTLVERDLAEDVQGNNRVEREVRATRVTIEDVAEEEDLIPPARKATRYIIEDPIYDTPDGDNLEEKSAEALATEQAPPPSQDSVKWLHPKRVAPSGRSAVGVSVVSIPGVLSEPEGPEFDLRLDSCADISLISEEVYRALAKPPPLRQGLRMRLWQLTDKNTNLAGFVKLPLYVRTESGELVGMHVEAYVVPNMSVPILLGEDFHLTYELTVQRSVEFGMSVHLGASGLTVKAQGVRRSGDFGRLRRSAVAVASFIKAKTHRRNKNARRRKRLALAAECRLVRAAADVRIPAHTCKKVPLDGPFEESGEWFVEKAVLGNNLDAALAIPNVLISSERPYIPVANVSSRPRTLCKGEVLANVLRPEDALYAPSTVEELQKCREVADRTAALLSAHREASGEPTTAHSDEKTDPSRFQRAFAVDQNGTTHKGSSSKDKFAPRPQRKVAPCAPSLDRSELPPEGWPAGLYANGSAAVARPAAEEEDVSWGPKTAEVPIVEDFASKDLRRILDVGELPEHLKERVWQMLQNRVLAFGFDGRLGHLETKCRIRMKEGVEPIAVPMYGASPAKRVVIDEQLKKWFAQGVIEPSESPWSAPVVIVYRNGKARFCVDYRKLNAVTIADEFPIPRQSEILSALSGAQVLSSLDALSGFTQMEIAREDVEKTAFRTHRGLFHFKRMPFGLRNGPSIFQRTMQAILAPYLWLFTLVYIDDI